MRVLYRAASVAFVLVTTLGGSASAQQKFAYIQSSILLEQVPGRAEAAQPYVSS